MSRSRTRSNSVFEDTARVLLTDAVVQMYRCTFKHICDLQLACSRIWARAASERCFSVRRYFELSSIKHATTSTTHTRGRVHTTLSPTPFLHSSAIGPGRTPRLVSFRARCKSASSFGRALENKLAHDYASLCLSNRIISTQRHRRYLDGSSVFEKYPVS
jgi:hypothetical protein